CYSCILFFSSCVTWKEPDPGDPALSILIALLPVRIKNQLRTSKQGDGLLTDLIHHQGIPHLGGPPAMYPRGNAGNGTRTRSIQKIAVQLDRGEVIRSAGKAGKCAVAAGRICQGNDDRRMQVTVGGEQFGANDESAGQPFRLHAKKFNAEQARQVTLAACVELFNRIHGGKYSTEENHPLFGLTHAEIKFAR